MLLTGFILGLLFSVVPPDTTVASKCIPPVYFRFDKSSVETGYMGNSSAIDSLANLIDNLGQENIQSIDISAFSSPDGNTRYNIELSKKRAYELEQLFRTRFPSIPESKITSRAEGEAWSMLRERIASDSLLSDTARERILKILDDQSVSVETRKWRLSNRLGSSPETGNLYSYILRNHYNRLRLGETRITVIQEPKEEEVPEEPDTLIVDNAEEAPEIVEPEPETAPENNVPLPPVVIPEIRRIPLLGISTNLLYDITYLPNYGITSIPSFSLEYYPLKGRMTYGADVEWPMWQHWDRHDFLQINNITLWTRRYFKPKTEDHFTGTYLLGNMNIARYGIGYNDKGWQGEGVGASLGFGYKKMIRKSRFFFDTGLALGVFWSKYDPYVYGFDATGWYYYDYNGRIEDFVERNHRLLWFGPTRIYFSIGYDILNRRKR